LTSKFKLKPALAGPGPLAALAAAHGESARAPGNLNSNAWFSESEKEEEGEEGEEEGEEGEEEEGGAPSTGCRGARAEEEAAAPASAWDALGRSAAASC